MGGGNSKSRNSGSGNQGGKGETNAKGEEAVKINKPTDLPEANRWHRDKQYDDENSLVYSSNDDYQELRNMLGEPVGQRYLGEFAKAENSHENFFAWIEMEEFKTIPTPDFRKCQGKQIFNKYIRKGAVMQLGGLNDQMIEMYKQKLRSDEELQERFFSAIQHMIFREMVANTFARFKQCEKYAEYKKARRDLYNRVSVEDFNYMEFLGGGAFGKVVRVVKKSTSREYAMKVVSKARMLEQLHHKDSKTKYEKLNIERNVLINSSFPFIIDMDYAFQTETEVMLVMEYARGGTLRDLVHTFPDKRMPEEDARYVICQVMLALRHLHYMNYVYRDLKPINVLISGRGFVKVADMGLVARIDENIKPVKDKKRGVEPAEANLDKGHPEGYDERPDGRRYTVVGTAGYKAPEMLQAKRSESRGYGVSVDWWSLGVMSLELLAGVNVYQPKLKALMMEQNHDRGELDVINSIPRASDTLSKALKASLSQPCKDFLDALLEVDPTKRLGTTPNGVRELREHPFFSCYDFDKMLNLEIPPPYKVKRKARKKKPDWATFRQMVLELETADISALLGSTMDNTVKKRHQRYFKNWDYVAQATFKLELNLQERRTVRAMTLNQDPDALNAAKTEVSTMVEEAGGEDESAKATKSEGANGEEAEGEHQGDPAEAKTS